MSDRGDYRSFYVSFWDDPDVHALSDAAYRVLTTLKGVLPASGIGVVYASQLAEQCRKTRAELDAALAELEEAKSDSDLGWIVRDRNVVWIVNALRFEPTLTASNYKHRTFVQRLLAPLGDKLPVVHDFRAHYAEFFPSEPSRTPSQGNGKASDTVSNGSRYPLDRVSNHSDSDSDSHRDVTSDSDRVIAARARFLARHYANATPERLAEVNTQLDQVLSPSGVVRPKQGIKAFATAATLDRAVTETFEPGRVKKPDAAIVVLLRILTDGKANADTDVRGRTVTEAASEDGKRQESADRVTLDRDLARFASWAAEHPSDASRIEAEVVAELPGPADNAFLEHARSVKRVHVWQREQRASRAVALTAGGAA